MDITIGLDIGTSKIGAVVLDGEGKVRGTASRANDSDVSGLPPGRHEQAPEAIRVACLDVLADIAGRLGMHAKSVRAIGLTGQMHGGLLVDAELAPLTNLVTWRDGRGGEAARGTTFLGEFRVRAGEDALREAGINPATGYLGVTLLWYALRAGGLPASSRWALCVHDWVAAWLSETEPATDASDAAGTGLLDVRRRDWHAGIVDALGLHAEILPPVRPCGSKLGRLTGKVARYTGLPEAATVHVGLGDNQASVLASVGDAATDIVLNVGTGGQVSAVSDRWVEAEGIEMRPYPGGPYLAVGASLCGGAAFRWLGQHYRRVVRLLVGHAPDLGDIMSKLVTAAARVGGDADLPVADVQFLGTRSDPDRRGALARLGVDNNTPGHWARAVLVGLVDELVGYYREMLTGGLAPRERCIGSGNGMRLNPVLRRLAADAMCMPLVLPAWSEEAACGAALAAMVGSGMLESFPAAGRLVQFS